MLIGKFFLAGAFIFLSAGVAQAKLEIGNQETQFFENKDCAANTSCDLKKFSLLRQDYKLTLSDGTWHLGVRVFAEYETGSMETLEQYGIVQFIRGCKFESSRDDDGTVVKAKNIKKHQFDDVKTLCFPNWVIDSVDKDPLYNSLPGKNRHYYYRWNTVPGSKDKNTEIYYGWMRPTAPGLYLDTLSDILKEHKPDGLYISDRPGTAFYYQSPYWKPSAINSSLEFKTCIYKAADIPIETTEDNVNFAKPIHCFTWKSSFIYNHDLGIFETKDTIDPFCLEENRLENK